MRRFLTILAVLLLGASALSAQTTPVMEGYFRDAAVCGTGRDYYMVCSSYGCYPGLTLYRSKDRVNWEAVGGCLSRRSQMEAVEGHAVVKGISYKDGIMTVTASCPKGDFQVSTNDPKGEWSEPEMLEVGCEPGLEAPSIAPSEPQAQYLKRPVDALSSGSLDQGWVWLGWPRRENYHFMKSGALRLVASPVKESRTFVAMRREREAFSVETEVTMDTKSLSSSEAGLSVYMSSEVHAELFLRKYPSSDLGFCPVAVSLRYTLCGLTHMDEEVMLPSGTAKLKVVGDASGCSFYCAGAGQEYQLLGTIDSRLLGVDPAGSAAGMLLGMYCTSEGTTPTYADFKCFRHQ